MTAEDDFKEIRAIEKEASALMLHNARTGLVMLTCLVTNLFSLILMLNPISQIQQLPVYLSLPVAAIYSCLIIYSGVHWIRLIKSGFFQQILRYSERERLLLERRSELWGRNGGRP